MLFFFHAVFVSSTLPEVSALQMASIIGSENKFLILFLVCGGAL